MLREGGAGLWRRAIETNGSQAVRTTHLDACVNQVTVRGSKQEGGKEGEGEEGSMEVCKGSEKALWW